MFLVDGLMLELPSDNFEEERKHIFFLVCYNPEISFSEFSNNQG